MSDDALNLVVHAAAIVLGGIGAGAAIGLLSRVKAEPPPLLDTSALKAPSLTSEEITADERPSGKRGPR